MYPGISGWLDDCLARGKHTFSLREVRQVFQSHSEVAIKRALSRLTLKRKIASVHKGFYVIITYEYSARGIVPPLLYIDALMKYLGRKYYISLLSAAALHGASHQAVQVLMVNTSFPILRPSIKKGFKIIFIPTTNIPTALIEKKKTPMGYVQVSSPELTAVDLVNFSKQIGGLNRAATVLNELEEEINILKINSVLTKHAETSTLQRLGYIFDEVLHNEKLANAFESVCKNTKRKFFPVALKSNGKRINYKCHERWRVIENCQLEPDE